MFHHLLTLITFANSNAATAAAGLSLPAMYGIVSAIDNMNKHWNPKIDPNLVAAERLLNQAIDVMTKANSMQTSFQGQGPTFYNMGGSSLSSFGTGCACVLGITAIVGIWHASSISHDNIAKKVIKDITGPLKEHHNEVNRIYAESTAKIATTAGQRQERIEQKIDWIKKQNDTFTKGFGESLADTTSDVLEKVGSIPQLDITRLERAETPAFSLKRAHSFSHSIRTTFSDDEKNIANSSTKTSVLQIKDLNSNSPLNASEMEEFNRQVSVSRFFQKGPCNTDYSE